MKKRTEKQENYLEQVPLHQSAIVWNTDQQGQIVLQIENNRVFDRLVQCFLKKPKISYIHLDENGSFIWNQINGTANLIEIGAELEEKFGEAVHPLYERLALFFQMLDRCGLIVWSQKLGC